MSKASMTPPTTRWMAIWLPRLSTDRLKRAAASPEAAPLALYAKIGNAFTLTAVDARASREGLSVGMPLADARAIAPGLIAHDADPDADARLLDHIAAWCERFTPIVVLDPPHGLFLDVTGCAHLFGDEISLLSDVKTHLRTQGLAAAVAIAPTPGAAWALVRFSPEKEAAKIADEHNVRAALSVLPIAALRLEPASTALLKRLGLKTIGQIIDAPRAPFAARAGQNTMLRLDQALGRAGEALSPRRPPPPVYALRRLLEPVIALDAVLIVTEALCADLCAKLDAIGMAARALRLTLFGVDGGTRQIELGLTQPERSAKTLLRLLREKLNMAAENFDAEFGFEAMRLDALAIAPINLRATDLAPTATTRDREAEARLIDMIAARLGSSCIGKLAVRDMHAPERASVWSKTSEASPDAAPEDGVMRRPLTLFQRAQPIEAMASVPDGPPARFRWRRVLREVTRAEGPERIAPNWLRAPNARTRDYYRVEDQHGRRYWLYREGLYDEREPPRWFIHGLFA